MPMMYNSWQLVNGSQLLFSTEILKLGVRFRVSVRWVVKSQCEIFQKFGIGSILDHFAFCRLGWAYSRLCWVSLYSTQPIFCRCYCQMRNPTTANFGTKPQKRLLRLDRPFFGSAAGLKPERW